MVGEAKPTGKKGVLSGISLQDRGSFVCVQLQVIETEDGPPEEDEKNLLHVVYHRLACVGLKIKILNTELVDVDLKTTEALTQSFLKNEGNKKLFNNLGRFRRTKKKAYQSQKKVNTPSCFFVFTGGSLKRLSKSAVLLNQFIELAEHAARVVRPRRRLRMILDAEYRLGLVPQSLNRMVV